MGTGTLNWYADRGFELDVEAAEDDVAIRLAAVPVPADGTDELRAGVDLDRLDILFKASVEIQGETAQLHEARVQLVTNDGRDLLDLDVRIEDVETGDILPVRVSVVIALPEGAPASGGPRPAPMDEDELDFEDETTLEQLVVNAPETPSKDFDEEDRLGPPPSGRSRLAPEKPAADKGGSEKGFQALLKALARLDDDEDDEPPSAEVERPAPARNAPPPPRPPTEEDEEAPADGNDQLLGQDGEARSLLEILVNGDHLELEGDAEVDGLVPGVAKILALPLPSEAKATRLSTWLLAQDEVADLFIGDEDLAEILERW